MQRFLKRLGFIIWRSVGGTIWYTPPIDPILAKMKAKDPELFASIWSLPVTDGIRAWREAYPSDFAGITNNTPVNEIGPHCVHSGLTRATSGGIEAHLRK